MIRVTLDAIPRCLVLPAASSSPPPRPPTWPARPSSPVCSPSPAASSPGAAPEKNLRVLVRDGHVVEAAYKEPFDLLFPEPKFEYDDVVDAGRL
jgi:hypothetical protein